MGNRKGEWYKCNHFIKKQAICKQLAPRSKSVKDLALYQLEDPTAENELKKIFVIIFFIKATGL